MITQHWGGETPRPQNPRNEFESLTNLPSSRSAGSLGTPPDDTESADAGPDRTPVRKRMPLAGGWVKLSRFWLGHHLLQNAWLCRLYVWCLLRANYQPGLAFGHQLAAGQFFCGRKIGAEELAVSESRFRRGMDSLEKQRLISRSRTSHGTIVTLRRWRRDPGDDSISETVANGQGFVKLYRSLLDSDLILEDEPLRVYIWALLKAGFTHREEQGQHLDPGEFLTGERISASQLGVSPSQFKTQLQELAERGWITLRPTRGWTIITVVDWEIEQSTPFSREPSTDQPTNQPATVQRPAVEPTSEHKRRRRSIQEFKTEKNSTSPSPSPAVADSGSDQSIPEVVVGELERILERLTPLVDVDPQGLARTALGIHPADRIHRMIDHFHKWQPSWGAGALVNRLKNELDDPERGWPPKDPKVEAKLKQEADKKREADRLDRERQQKSEEHDALAKVYNAKLAALEPAFGARVDALTSEEIADIAKRDFIVRQALKANPRPRNALLTALSTQDGHSKQMPTAPELAPAFPPGEA